MCFLGIENIEGVVQCKDCMPKELRNVVYFVKCGTCDNEYVGRDPESTWSKEEGTL